MAIFWIEFDPPLRFLITQNKFRLNSPLYYECKNPILGDVMFLHFTAIGVISLLTLRPMNNCKSLWSINRALMTELHAVLIIPTGITILNGISLKQTHIIWKIPLIMWRLNTSQPGSEFMDLNSNRFDLKWLNCDRRSNFHFGLKLSYSNRRKKEKCGGGSFYFSLRES